MRIKIWARIYYAARRCEFSWWEDKKVMTIINWGALCYIIGTSGLNYKVAQNFGVSLDEETKSNLKLIKDKVL